MAARHVLARLIAAFVCISTPIGLAAQNSVTGAVAGVITDSSDAVVANAHITLKDDAKGTIQNSSSGLEGSYGFAFLRPGNYTLSVTKAGFAPTRRKLTIYVGKTVALNVNLPIAAGTMTITVTAVAPLLQSGNGDAATTVTERQIASVPNPGNDLTYIAQTTPGTIMNTDGGAGAFSNFGVSALSNEFTLNGMSYNGIGATGNVTGALNMLLGQNEVQEATVVSNGYSGQFGDVAGANVNYISKSGGNAFHGNAKYFWNGRILNANDWIANANGLPRPFDNANQWAGSFGGPLKRDKLFFFFNTEGIRLLLPLPPFTVQLPSPEFESATVANVDGRFGATSASDSFYRKIFALYNATPRQTTTSPGGFGDALGCSGFVGPNGLGTSAPCAVHFVSTRGRPTDESLISGRMDSNFRSSDRAFLLIQYDHGHQASYTDPVSSLFDADSEQPWWQGQLSETHTFGASTANQFLIAGWWFSAIFKPRDLPETLKAFPTVLTWNNGAFINLGGNDNFSGVGDNFTNYEVADDVTKTLSSHKLGFGGRLHAENQTGRPYSANAIGVLAPQTLDAFYQGGLDPKVAAGSDENPDFTTLQQSFATVTATHFHSAVLSLYGTDDWKVRPGLSFTLSLRIEHPVISSCENHCFARLRGAFDSLSHDPNIGYNQVIVTGKQKAYDRFDNFLWMPRFGFAWQPRGVSRNTVMRGGIGVFYDLVPGSLATVFALNPPVLNSFIAFGDNLAPGEKTNLFTDAAASNTAFLKGFANGQTLSQIQAAIASIDPAGFDPPSLVLPGARMHEAQYQKWDLELEQLLGTSTSLTIGYYGNHGIHELVVDPSANAYGFGTLPSGKCSSPPVPPCADPRFSQVSVWNTPGVSNYNGLTMSIERRWTAGLLRANYSWGHAFDEMSNSGIANFTQSGFLTPQDPHNVHDNYGAAEYDARHSLNLSYVWESPVKAGLRGHGPDWLVKGWQLAGTIYARTSFPYSVIDWGTAGRLGANNFGGPIYAVPAHPFGSTPPCGEGAAVPSATEPCFPPETLPNGTPNPGALFVQPGCETGFNTGTLPSNSGPCGGSAVAFVQGRNRFRGPGFFSTDLSIMKNTRLQHREGVTWGIGAQFFNFFNHPNFGLPDGALPDNSFGQIPYMQMPPTSILGSGLGGDVAPRMIQLKVQVQF